MDHGGKTADIFLIDNFKRIQRNYGSYVVFISINYLFLNYDSNYCEYIYIYIFAIDVFLFIYCLFFNKHYFHVCRSTWTWNFGTLASFNGFCSCHCGDISSTKEHIPVQRDADLANEKWI